MTNLENQKVPIHEIELALGNLSGWSFSDNRIAKEFKFHSFPEAMAFMMLIAFDAERLCHHPNWTNIHNTVQVELWSHDLGGVSQLCLELAHCMNRQFADTV